MITIRFSTFWISLIWSGQPLIQSCGVTFLQRVHPIWRNDELDFTLW